MKIVVYVRRVKACIRQDLEWIEKITACSCNDHHFMLSQQNLRD